MNSSHEIVIIGGGPAGGLAALLLARAGRRVTLLEAQPDLGERVCGLQVESAGQGRVSCMATCVFPTSCWSLPAAWCG